MDFQRLEALYKDKGYTMPAIKPGQYLEIQEKMGDRIWKFKGLVIKVWKPAHPDGTFTIRGAVAGNTIEKVYPFSFPKFEKITLLDEYKTKRSKLYYIREKVGKDAKFKSKITTARKDMNLLAK